MSLWVIALENRPWCLHQWPLGNFHVRRVCNKHAASVITELLIGQHSSDQISGRWKKKEEGGGLRSLARLQVALVDSRAVVSTLPFMSAGIVCSHLYACGERATWNHLNNRTWINMPA